MNGGSWARRRQRGSRQARVKFLRVAVQRAWGRDLGALGVVWKGSARGSGRDLGRVWKESGRGLGEGL